MWQLQEQCTIQFSYFLLLYTETEFQKRLIIIYLWHVSFNCSVRYFEKKGPRTYRFNAVYFCLLHEKSANLLNKIAHFIRIADIIHVDPASSGLLYCRPGQQFRIIGPQIQMPDPVENYRCISFNLKFIPAGIIFRFFFLWQRF